MSVLGAEKHLNWATISTYYVSTRSTTCVAAGHHLSTFSTYATFSLKYWDSVHSPHLWPCFAAEVDTFQSTEPSFINTYTTMCYLEIHVALLWDEVGQPFFDKTLTQFSQNTTSNWTNMYIICRHIYIFVQLYNKHNWMSSIKTSSNIYSLKLLV
jgi:hypothetical protein